MANTINTAVMEEKIKKYKDYDRIIREVTALKDAVGDDIKAEMDAAGASKLIIGDFKVIYADCQRKTLDQKQLERAFGDLSKYTRITTYKRFSVA